MNDRAVGIITNNGKLLTFWRYRNGEEYYILPGGTMEEGEEPEETLKREIFEELNFNVEIGEKLFEYFNEHVHPRTDRYFLITKFSGDIKMGAPELTHQNRENIFRPEWIEIKNLENVKLMPEEAKKQLIEALNKLNF